MKMKEVQMQYQNLGLNKQKPGEFYGAIRVFFLC